MGSIGNIAEFNVRIRWRPPFSLVIAALLVGTVSTVMVITAFLDIANAKSEFRIHTEQKAILVASSVAALTADAIYARDIAKLENAVDSVLKQNSLSFVGIADENGQGLAQAAIGGSDSGDRMKQHAPQLGHQARMTGAPVFSLEGNHAMIAHPVIVADSEVLGSVVIGFEDSALEATVQTITTRRIRQAGGLIAASIIVSVIFASRLTRSIGQLERGVRRITAGDLSTQVSPQGPRELRNLGQAFNSMASRLNIALAEVERNRAELEQRVSDRTLELEVLSDVARQFPSDFNTDDALGPFADLVLKILPGTSIAVAGLDEDGHQLNVKANYGYVPAGLGPGQMVAIEDAPWLDAFALGEPIVEPCLIPSGADDNFNEREGPEDESLMLIVPLTSRGDAIGMLVFVRPRNMGFSLSDRRFSQTVGTRISGALAEERERRVRGEKSELQRIEKSKNEFLSNITHELITPLTSILAFTSVLKKNKPGNLSPQQVTHLDLITRNGQRLNTLIADLLDLSRIDTDRFNISTSPFSVGDLLIEVELSFLPVLQAKYQTIRVELNFSEAWINGDRSRIAQVLSNLLNNASKYSEEKTEIRLVAHLDDDVLSIMVEDQGAGIKPDDLEKVCDLFFRAEEFEESAIPGTGIGLYVTKKIVELHGGTFSLQSGYGIGTTALIKIPGATQQNPAPQTPSQTTVRSRFEELDIGVPSGI